MASTASIKRYFNAREFFLSERKASLPTDSIFSISVLAFRRSAVFFKILSLLSTDCLHKDIPEMGVLNVSSANIFNKICSQGFIPAKKQFPADRKSVV